MVARKIPSIPAVPSVNYPDLAATFQAIRQNVDLLWTEMNLKAAKAQPWEYVVIIPSGATNGDYDLIINSTVARKIKFVTTKSASGTATIKLKIGGIDLTGTANPVSSTEKMQAFHLNNDLRVGQDLVMNIASASSLGRVVITISGSYTQE